VLTPRQIFEERVPRQLREDRSLAEELGGKVHFEVLGQNGGSWIVDFLSGRVFEGKPRSADCSFVLGTDDFVALHLRELSGPEAIMTGRIKIEGDMSLALKMGRFFG
jgi:putative sterol carrier protein